MKSVGESGPGSGGQFGGGGGPRGRGWENQGRDGDDIPAWMDSDEDEGAGTFDEEGQFRREKTQSEGERGQRKREGEGVDRGLKENWDDEEENTAPPRSQRPKEERVDPRERHKVRG